MDPDDFKAWRKRLGFNQDEAAHALGLSRSTIINYESGRRRENNRPVEIPMAIAYACDSLAIKLAAERCDPSVLSDEQRERVIRAASVLPSEWRKR